MKEKPAISCIIPVFNEEKTVDNVIQTCLKSQLFDQVICINDGSKDQTLNILKSFGKKIILINFRRNYGKGAAMAAGIKKAKGEIIVFLDADHLNLKKHHLKQLVDPLVAKKVKVVLGHNFKFDPFTKLTGERAYFRLDLLPYCQTLKKKRFGAEVYLNQTLKNKKTKLVYLRGLKTLFKHQKMGLNQEMINAYLKEALEVSQEFVRLQGKTVGEKIKLQRKLVKKFLNKYLQQTKEIERLLKKSKTFKKLKKLLEL